MPSRGMGTCLPVMRYKRVARLGTNTRCNLGRSATPSIIPRHDKWNGSPASSAPNSVDAATDLAVCFLRLANLPNFSLDRLSRYEATLCVRPARPAHLRAR